MLIGLLIVVLMAVVGFVMFSHPATTDGKINTEINFLSDANLQNGYQAQFVLKEVQGKPIAGENVSISYNNLDVVYESEPPEKDENVSMSYDDGRSFQNYSVITDQNGNGFFTISGKVAGRYDVTVTYNGNDHYNGCSVKQTLKVEEQ